MEEKPKFDQRAYIREYKSKTYSPMYVWVRKEIAERFKKRLGEKGDTASGVFHKAIERYLNEED